MRWRKIGRLLATGGMSLLDREDPPDWPLVEVHWEDATNSGPWADLEEAQMFDIDTFEFDWHCRSVGYLIRSDAECVVLAARRSGEGKQVGLIERIPRGMVQRMDTLRPGRVRC